MRLNQLDEYQDPEVEQISKETFYKNCFIPVINQFISSLTERIAAYDLARERFGFLNQIDKMNSSDLSSAATNLVRICGNDLEPNLGNELTQFSVIIDLYKEDSKDNIPRELFFYQLLFEKDLLAAFPNVEIALRMYLVLMVSNCSGERSFSKMKIIKNILRTTMNQDRLSWLTLLSIEYDLLRKLDFKETVESFASQKVRKHIF